MAACNVIDMAFNDLWSKGVLKEGKTRIEDPVRFDTLNKLYSDVARTKYGVKNDGLLFDVNTQSTSVTGPLNIYSHKGESSFMNQFAVINREFSDEFQKKFDDFNSNKPGTTIPATISPNLQKKYNSIKENIDNAGYPVDVKNRLLDELNDCRTLKDFGELMKKLC